MANEVCDCGQPVEVVYLERFGTIYCHSDTKHFYCEKRLDHASVKGVNRPGGCAVRTVPLPEYKHERNVFTGPYSGRRVVEGRRVMAVPPPGARDSSG
jgi:hypothetical protein